MFKKIPHKIQDAVIHHFSHYGNAVAYYNIPRLRRKDATLGKIPRKNNPTAPRSGAWRQSVGTPSNLRTGESKSFTSRRVSSTRECSNKKLRMVYHVPKNLVIHNTLTND